MYLVLALAHSLSAPVADNLPDVSLLPSYLAQAYTTTSNPELPGGTLALRFPTASVNFAPGRLELRGGEVVGNQQRVYQRVYRTDGSTYDRPAGWFIYHSGHGHIHFESWTQFILRKRLPNGAVGEVVGTGAKTSFCILEIVAWDPSIAGHTTPPAYGSCGQIQGLRPGWADVYGATLEGQYINLTNIPNGNYWLEGFIDPNNQVLETNETNNQVLVPINIGTPPAAQPDAYEQNDSIAEVDTKTEGAPNSPNLGVMKVKKTIRNLSMEDPADWYKIRTLKTGGPGDYVRIESPWNRTANLDLELYNSSGAFLTRSSASYNFEQLSLNGRAAGTYYVRVVRNGTTNNPEYWLTIDPAGGNPPLANLDGQNPEGGPVQPYVQKAYETIPISWTYGLGSSAPRTVSLFRSRTKDADDAEVIDGYEGTPGHVKAARILTNQFDVGRWFIFARFESGGAHTDVWMPNATVVYRKGDTNFDGRVTVEEANALLHGYLQKNESKLPEGWDVVCDMDDDKDVDMKDYQLMYKAAEHGD